MKLIIDKNRKVYSAGTWGTKNENNYEILNFEFPEELEEYNKRIVYYLGDERVWDAIVNNKAYITNAITTKGDVKAYVWCTKENTEREADTDFRTMLFEMHFYENENADGIVPTPEQVDGFNTMLTEMNAKIDEVDALETTIEGAEADRVLAEQGRVNAENTRVSNESTRQTNEQTRQSQEAERERRTDEAIGEIEDLTEAYNQNAEAKTNEFNQNATQKTNDFNSNYTQKVNDFNTNASSKELAFNSNAESKTSTFNTNATNKTNDFNTNAENKTSAFNTNANDKTSAFNDNATQKTTNFDNNASEKTTAYNENAQNKIDEYDEHIVEYQAQIDELQEEVEELSQNMPWTETEQAIEISVDDAAKYSKNKLELFGNTSQDSTTGKNLFDNSVERKNAYPGGDIREQIAYVNSNATYSYVKCAYLEAGKTYTISWQQNIAPASKNVRVSRIIDENNINLASFNSWRSNSNSISYTPNVSGYLVLATDINSTNIMIEEGSTATDYEPYTNGPSPNPDYPQDIHVVTGNNTISVGNTDYPINLGNIELCKIGDYQDYLYKENGNWYKYEITSRIVFDGSENWRLYSSVNPGRFYIANFFGGTYPPAESFCNKFLRENYSNWSSIQNNHYSIQLPNQALWFIHTDTETLAEWKEWLSNNNVVLRYLKSNPESKAITTQITDETLVSQLDAIYEHLQLVKGTNNITVTAEDLAPYMQLSYMQDLPSKLDNLDSRLSLLE